jgi:hypothetical protein
VAGRGLALSAVRESIEKYVFRKSNTQCTLVQPLRSTCKRSNVARATIFRPGMAYSDGTELPRARGARGARALNVL